MVKNSLSASTHSLRGSQSTLSLRQTVTTNAELEAARQKIKDLESALEAKETTTAVFEPNTKAEYLEKMIDLQREMLTMNEAQREIARQKYMALEAAFELANKIDNLIPAPNAELETARQKIADLEQEMGRMEITKQNELERLEVERYNEVKRLEAEKLAEVKRLEAEKLVEVKRVEQEKGEKITELKRLEAEKYTVIRRLEKEVRRIEQEALERENVDWPAGSEGLERRSSKNAQWRKEAAARVASGSTTNAESTPVPERLTFEDSARIERETMEYLRDIDKKLNEKEKEPTKMQQKLEAFHKARKEVRGEVQVIDKAPSYPTTAGQKIRNSGVSGYANLHPRAHPTPPPSTGHQPSTARHPLDPSTLSIMSSPFGYPSVPEASIPAFGVHPPPIASGSSAYPSLAPYDPAWRPSGQSPFGPAYRATHTVNPSGPMTRGEFMDGMNLNIMTYKRANGSGEGRKLSPLPVSPPAQVERKSMSLFERYEQDIQQGCGNGKSLITKALSMEKLQKEKVDNTLKSPEAYTQPFCDFLTENPTVWHAVSYFEEKLGKAGFKKLSERKTWNDELTAGGKYYTTRNGSSLIAFTVGAKYKSGNGVAMVAGHVDALTARLKPISNKKTSAGYLQLGIAPYAGALNSTWWDRDLGVGGRVIVQDPVTKKVSTKLVKLGWPIARIPTLAPHFGIGMTGQDNKETQLVPIIGLDDSSSSSANVTGPCQYCKARMLCCSGQNESADRRCNNCTRFQMECTQAPQVENTLGSAGSFAATQPPKLVRAIAGELSIKDFSSIINWELELYDTQPAQTGGLDKEFIFGGRIDDKVCSWAAIEGLLASTDSAKPASIASPSSEDGLVKLVGVFDDEEIGSQLRQGAKSNFLPQVIERITESFAPSGTLSGANLLSQTYANSFLISADVTHAVNPNFLASYLEDHAPRLNVGLTVAADSNGHMTTDSVSTALLTKIAEKSDNKLQLFMIRNDSRSGGTVGPMLSSAMGVRAIDAGIPQLSMHSIRATIGNLDPGLGVKAFAGFFDYFEEVDGQFE